jgi:molybdenum cofactor guanylyltransferase
MKLLGAVLAGGASTRFGSDKAIACVAGTPLLDHVIAALACQVDAMAIVGRDWRGLARIDDLPAAGLGPLGGLCGALAYATAQGFDAVLCVPCDTLGLPPDLATRLLPGPAVALGQRSIGVWPARLAPVLLARLTNGDTGAIRRWASDCAAREVDCGRLHNINHPDDLDQPRSRAIVRASTRAPSRNA